jgi:2-C-methyl-D-erythritol 4-phosphate cytidylyltransferase
MSESLSAVVVAAGRSQRMGFDKMLTSFGGRPLLVHTLERLFLTEIPAEIVLVVRPGSEAELEPILAPLREKGTIRLVPGGAQRQDSVQAGLRAVAETSEFVLVHDAARPFITRELVEAVLAAAKITGAAVCGAPCSDSLKEVGEDGLVVRTVDRSKLWAVQTPQIFRTALLREAYERAVQSGALFTDDTAVVEQAGHPVRIVLHHGVNLKVTTPTDWKLAETFLQFGEPGSPEGQELRRLLHDVNNYLTPLLGYSYLLVTEFPEEGRPKKFATNIQSAAEKCQHAIAAIHKLIRELFPRKNDGKPS